MGTTKAEKAKVAERRAQAITLRIAGMDWQSIADRLGYSSRGAACQDVARALEANLAEQSQAADTLREVESLRLDRLQAAAWPSAVKGELKAIDTVLKVIDRRAKLNGLDMPVRTELTGASGGPVVIGAVGEGELEKLIARVEGVCEAESEDGGAEDEEG